eukprot:64752-Chlamydomonas_euryale.AAC.9
MNSGAKKSHRHTCAWVARCLAMDELPPAWRPTSARADCGRCMGTRSREGSIRPCITLRSAAPSEARSGVFRGW